MMLALGPYRFSLNTSAYQSLKRSSEYRWPSIERIGKEPLLQAIGAGSDRIDLDGVIYPHFRGGLGQINAMRDSAQRQEPLMLINGQGNVLGRFVITQIEESQNTFLADGAPRKIEFRLSLERYGEE
ncbi:MAG: phage tail protein [Candidatus Paracaedibacteraceae bacterium]|nr:phage tail protein [Candidatus Paracaedibacteraceae bacterium]